MVRAVTAVATRPRAMQGLERPVGDDERVDGLLLSSYSSLFLAFASAGVAPSKGEAPNRGNRWCAWLAGMQLAQSALDPS